MAANGPKEEVEWELDWDDLTEGASAPPPVMPVVEAPRDVAPTNTPPPLPQQPQAFPPPSSTFPDDESATIVPPQRLPTVAPVVPLQSAATGPVALPQEPAKQKVRSLVRGQRLRLSEIVASDQPPAFAVGLEIAAPSGVSVDRCCFGLDENGKLSDDRYFVFYNQKESPEGAISMRGAWREIFQVELARLPVTIRRLVFTATVDGKGSLRQLGASRFELHPMGGTGGARYEFSGSDLDDVKALMVAEIYFKDGWRLAAVGQGFAGGLSELLKHFGGQEA